MSGPKGFRVSVVSAAELRRREDEARSASCDQLAITLAGFSVQLERFGRTLPIDVSEPAVRTHDSLLAWEQSLLSALTEARAELRAEAARDLARRVAAAERAASSRELDTSGVRLGGSHSLDLQATLAIIADVRDDAARGELADAAEHLFRGAAVGEPEPGRDAIALRRKAEAGLEAQNLRDLASQAVLSVAHLPTARAMQIRSRAALVSTIEELSAIRTEIAELLDAATRASDARFVESALRAVLSELGYTIGEGFELEDFGRPVAIGDHPDHPGYAVRLQVNPQNGMLYTRLVADGDTAAEADAQAESASCSTVRAIAEDLEGHGVAADLVFERHPGDAPVERRQTPATGGRRRRPRLGGTDRTRSA